MRDVYIYLLGDPTDQSVRYVGLTRNPKKRFGNHKNGGSHSPHIRNWVAKLKHQGLLPTMEIVAKTSELIAGELEAQWILAYLLMGADLINLTSGGEGRYAMSEESIQKIRNARRSRKMKPFTDEHRLNMSLCKRGKTPYPRCGERLAEYNRSRRGIPLSEEHKRKCGEAVSAAMTPEVRAKLREAGLRWYAAAKPPRCGRQLRIHTCNRPQGHFGLCSYKSPQVRGTTTGNPRVILSTSK